MSPEVAALVGTAVTAAVGLVVHLADRWRYRRRPALDIAILAQDVAAAVLATAKAELADAYSDAAQARRDAAQARTDAAALREELAAARVEIAHLTHLLQVARAAT